MKEQLAQTAAELKRDDQIMFIEELPDRAELVVLTNRDARWYALDGALRRSVKFPKTLWAPIVTTLAAGDEPVVVGLRLSNLEMLGGPKSRVDVLSLNGQRIVDIEAWKYGDVLVSDVVGDASKEILVRFRDGVKVFDLRGRLLSFVRAAEYLYQFQAMDADADGKDDLLLWMASRTRGEATVQVSTATGRELFRWQQPEANRLSVLHDVLDRPALGWFAGDTLRVASAAGAVLKTLDMPGAASYRYTLTGRLPNGCRVFLGTGAVGHSAVWVFDLSGRLVFHERLDGQSWSLAVSKKANRFFVGNGVRLWSYREERTP